MNLADNTRRMCTKRGKPMSKTKRYAIDEMGEDGFAQFLEIQNEGSDNGQHNQEAH